MIVLPDGREIVGRLVRAVLRVLAGLQTEDGENLQAEDGTVLLPE